MGESVTSMEVDREEAGQSPYLEWLLHLDENIQDKVTSQVTKLSHGIGDIKTLGEGLFELRIHFGPGFRIYFVNRTNTIVLLLAGSSKKDQKRTIRLARKIKEREL